MKTVIDPKKGSAETDQDQDQGGPVKGAVQAGAGKGRKWNQGKWGKGKWNQSGSGDK